VRVGAPELVHSTRIEVTRPSEILKILSNIYKKVMIALTLWPKAASPLVVRVLVVSLHTRCREFPPQRPAHHLLPPSPMYYISVTVASASILRRCAPVTLFVYHARRLFKRACRKARYHVNIVDVNGNAILKHRC